MPGCRRAVASCPAEQAGKLNATSRFHAMVGRRMRALSAGHPGCRRAVASCPAGLEGKLNANWRFHAMVGRQDAPSTAARMAAAERPAVDPTFLLPMTSLLISRRHLRARSNHYLIHR